MDSSEIFMYGGNPIINYFDLPADLECPTQTDDYCVDFLGKDKMETFPNPSWNYYIKIVECEFCEQSKVQSKELLGCGKIYQQNLPDYEAHGI